MPQSYISPALVNRWRQDFLGLGAQDSRSAMLLGPGASLLAAMRGVHAILLFVLIPALA